MNVGHVEILVEEPSMEAALRLLCHACSNRFPLRFTHFNARMSCCSISLIASVAMRIGSQKLEAARAVMQYMDPVRNTSRSFQVFRDVLLEMVDA
jgi:hypothetical protein